MTVDEYLDLARTRQALKSDDALAPFLGIKRASVNHYRTKRAWPSDATMVRLAELAGVPVERALMDLNGWRTTGPAARAVYQRLAARFAAGMLAFLLILPAGTKAEQAVMGSPKTIHYATILDRIRRALTGFFNKLLRALPFKWWHGTETPVKRALLASGAGGAGAR